MILMEQSRLIKCAVDTKLSKAAATGKKDYNQSGNMVWKTGGGPKTVQKRIIRSGVNDL